MMPNGLDHGYNVEWCNERHRILADQMEENNRTHEKILKSLMCLERKLGAVTWWAMIGPGLLGVVIGAILTFILKREFGG